MVKKRKSQFAMEYMMLVGILLVILIPIIYYSTRTLDYEVRTNQATEAVKALAKTADTVYSLGPGNQRFVQIIIPSGSITIGQNEILFKLKSSAGDTDIFETTSAVLVGGSIDGSKISSDPQNPTFVKGGIYNFRIEMNESSVLVGERSA